MPRADDGAGSEAFRLGPRQLLGTKFALRRTVGQVQANGDGFGTHALTKSNNTFDLVVHFSWMLADRDGALFEQASGWLDEHNGFNGGLIAQFKSVLCKRPYGAPHGHALGKDSPLINATVPKDDSLRQRSPTMATEWNVRKRRPVRRKNIAPLLKRLEVDLDIDLNVDGAFLEMAEYGPWTMVFVDKIPLVIEVMSEADERHVFLTLRGFLDHLSALKWVEVDHGAIPFLMNGADCMVAGVHGAEASVAEGDLVWIRDMTHKRPLALGWALQDASTLIESTKGKGIKTVHWVGDDLWEME